MSKEINNQSSDQPTKTASKKVAGKELYPYHVLFTATQSRGMQSAIVVPAADEKDARRIVAAMVAEKEDVGGLKIIKAYRYDTSPHCQQVYEMFDKLQGMGINPQDVLSSEVSMSVDGEEVVTAEKKIIN